jgi:hypothetical protein
MWGSVCSEYEDAILCVIHMVWQYSIISEKPALSFVTVDVYHYIYIPILRIIITVVYNISYNRHSHSW